MVSQLPRNDNTTDDPYVWLYGSDLWTGNVNEGKAGSHWEPLRFTENGDIEPLQCYVNSYELDIKVQEPRVVPVQQQAAVASKPGNYTWSCELGTRNQNILYQFFRATKTGNVTEFGVNIAEQANDYELQLYFGAANTDDPSELYTPSGGVKNLWSGIKAIGSVGWALPMLTASPNVNVTEVSSQTAISIIYIMSIGGKLTAMIGKILRYLSELSWRKHSVLLFASLG